jgi:hypothetical protein
MHVFRDMQLQDQRLLQTHSVSSHLCSLQRFEPFNACRELVAVNSFTQQHGTVAVKPGILGSLPSLSHLIHTYLPFATLGAASLSDDVLHDVHWTLANDCDILISLLLCRMSCQQISPRSRACITSQSCKHYLAVMQVPPRSHAKQMVHHFKNLSGGTCSSGAF